MIGFMQSPEQPEAIRIPSSPEFGVMHDRKGSQKHAIRQWHRGLS